MNRISSKDNKRLKDAVRVRKGKVRDRIFVEGRRLAAEALKSGLPIESVFVSTGFAESGSGRDMLDEAVSTGAFAAEIPDRLFSGLADTSTPQGIVLLCRRPRWEIGDLKMIDSRGGKQIPFAVFLSGVSNPGNLGAILRTAEAAGVAGVITGEDSADAFSPAVLRSSMGAAFRLPIVEKLPSASANEWARGRGLRVICTDSKGGVRHDEADWRHPAMIVFGSEAHGLSEEDIGKADEVVSIPLSGGVESLNLAVAAGIILFEARKACLSSE